MAPDMSRHPAPGANAMSSQGGHSDGVSQRQTRSDQNPLHAVVHAPEFARNDIRQLDGRGE
jgi:hypothetical protein